MGIVPFRGVNKGKGVLLVVEFNKIDPLRGKPIGCNDLVDSALGQTKEPRCSHKP